ncbi:MAG: opioid growth factor receptor-related protein [Burkholderiaceae bacterium]
MDRLLAFYLGSHPDDRGRMLREILDQNDTWFELTHDFIQWLFPLPEVSHANPHAPLLTRDVATLFRTDDILKRHLTASFLRMLRFYGLERRDGQIQRSSQWPTHNEWFREGGHNNLRITRILRCLTLCGMSEDARALLNCLEQLRAEEPACGVGDRAFSFWRAAIVTRL